MVCKQQELIWGLNKVCISNIILSNIFRSKMSVFHHFTTVQESWNKCSFKDLNIKYSLFHVQKKRKRKTKGEKKEKSKSHK